VSAGNATWLHVDDGSPTLRRFVYMAEFSGRTKQVADDSARKRCPFFCVQLGR
jgi:hypothetical protein